MRRLRRLARALGVAVLAVLVVNLAASLVFPLPALDSRLPSQAVAASPETRLGAALGPLAAQHPDRSGILSLRRGPDAFAARVLLARAAQASIDAQYYIWQNDVTGLLLLDELRQAAERGVRVRLLLDDVGTGGLDAEIAALDALPGAEVRLFNPLRLRSPRAAAFLIDPLRLNRRMHNKSFTVDGTVTIVGGRNVGDIYFGAATDRRYSDFDLLAAGPAAAATAAQFDAYWASGSSYPLAGLDLPPADPALIARRAQESAALPEAQVFADAVAASTLTAELAAGTVALSWVPAEIVADDPDKGLGLATSDGLLIARLSALLTAPETRVTLISAYFIPGRRGTDLIAGLARRGLKVQVLTNALQSTDVLLVHSGYARYRRPLLDAGVELYEMKSAAQPREPSDHFGLLSSATSSLHAKVLTLDGARVFVGSFNFDPRSFFLNTEMGILVDDPALAAEFDGIFAERVRLNAYRVVGGAGGDPHWIEALPDGGEAWHLTEPGTTWVQRAAVTVLGWLPIAWML